jgi:short-subunit dehydrogenase involved in D-alanine esterification of teichoic acids
MRAQKKPGAILNIGSVAGLYPMTYEPIYSGTKGSMSFIYLIINFKLCFLNCDVVSAKSSDSLSKLESR